jgi:hypothetical protein
LPPILLCGTAEMRFEWADRRFGDFVTVDPNVSPKIWVWRDWIPTREPASLERILAHEFGHALTGVGDTGLLSLKHVRTNESPVAVQLGEPRRIWH